ncbi:hypothetical protein SteCoe_8134 [Stentor coeruleus]|uniref:EF-hand domain-containing protein n=1 Tax=Stentor coeruleus TaxID=5963 RepID=A0A1R2CKY6_9CILI|nr:hypothetical protein SteCoe_8134 [Stentor coeruleus]
MLSPDTESRLADIFLRTAQQEKEVEECRYSLSKNLDFDPYSTFKILDRLGLGSLSSLEIQEILNRHHFFCSDDEAYLIIRQFDSNLDGRLSPLEFHQIVLPSTNPGLRDLALARRGVFSQEVEYLFVALLQAEVLYHRNLESIRREIILKSDLNLLEAFRTIDTKNASNIDRNALTSFLKKFRNVYDDDIDAILRRVDNDGDGLISYLEFVDCVMPSRSTSGVKNGRQGSPGQTSYKRNSSPLRNSQFTFKNSSPPKERQSFQAPLRSYVDRSITYKSREDCDRTYDSLQRGGTANSPNKSSPLRRASPLRRSSPLKNSSIRPDYQRPSAISSISLNEYSRQSIPQTTIENPRQSSPLRAPLNRTHSSPLKDSSFRASSPLRYSTLNAYQRSPDKSYYETADFNKSTEYRNIQRKSSPLRRSSPNNSVSFPTLNSSQYQNQNSRPNPIELNEVVSGFKEEIKISREIESCKNNLSLKHDFNLVDAFRMFDQHDLGMIGISDMENTLSYFSFRASRDELYLLVKHYSRLQDNRLRFSDFCDIFTPKQEEYSKLIRNRPAFNIPGIDRKKLFARDTLNVFLNTFRLVLDAEIIAERIRQRMSNLPGFSLYQAFIALDKDKNGFITMNEFQSVLQSQGIIVYGKDLQGLMEKYDKNKDGRVSYSEFVDEVTPKSPQRY